MLILLLLVLTYSRHGRYWCGIELKGPKNCFIITITTIVIIIIVINTVIIIHLVT